MYEKIIGKKTNQVRDQLEAVAKPIDSHDPNYDSEGEDDYVLVEMDLSRTFQDKGRHSSSYHGEKSAHDKPVINYEEFSSRWPLILDEYLTNEDSAEATEALKALNCPSFYDDLVARVVLRACDRDTKAQQLTSALLTVMYDSHVLTKQHLTRGFEKLIQRADDIVLDDPGFREQLVSFIDCAIADGCLDASFAHRYPQQFLRALMETEDNQREYPQLKEQLDQLVAYRGKMAECVDEFLEGGGEDEVKRTLSESSASSPVSFQHEFVKKLITASCDRSDRHREIVSSLLSSIYGKEVKGDDIQLAFSRLMAAMDDWTLDCPRAPEYLLNFMLRAVVDEILPPIFLQNALRLRVGGTSGMDVARKAMALLSEGEKCLTARFRKIWTGVDPTSDEAMRFKEELHTTILEYFDSLEKDEALRCVKEMDLAPPQAAELVRKTISLAMERSGRECEAALGLISHLKDAKELHADDIIRGFNDTADRLHELKLDVPDAPDMLKSFVVQGIEQEILPRRFELKQLKDAN
ncbi:unnamed protein product [Vitrella brassicaformis CCMP3155]|uniref:MI domain-containing protein n=2 Tax=Vitrella brassicaformis TaxID=1169539 RepID=A0A0G4EMZ4_VITBC|nr:unnamed protein product [Vitrella brassicaformis CCMP3155]|eukprot:CEL99197.1 unnamed protein product [Vitrella brassicaformis CCMP3155]